MLDRKVTHLLILHGGMGVKEVKALDAAHAAIPDNEAHVLLATGSYRGEVITQITKYLKQA